MSPKHGGHVNVDTYLEQNSPFRLDSASNIFTCKEHSFVARHSWRTCVSVFLPMYCCFELLPSIFLGVIVVEMRLSIAATIVKAGSLFLEQVFLNSDSQMRDTTTYAEIPVGKDFLNSKNL